MDDSDLLQSPRKRQKLDSVHVESSRAAFAHLDNHTQGSSTVMEVDTNRPPKEVIPDSSLGAEDIETSDQSKEGLPVSISVQDDPRSKELQVGIKELVNPALPGFSGILKKRYTDFLVNEILPSGEVVHLDNLKAPRAPNEVESSKEKKTLKSAQVAITQAQVGHVVDSAPMEQPHDGETPELRTISSSQELRQGLDQVDRNLQGDFEKLNELTSEPKVSPKQNGNGAESSMSQSGPKDISKDEVHESLEPNLSKNAFPEPNKDLNHWQAFAKGQPGFQASLSTENSETLNSFFGPDVVSELLALFNRVVDSPHRKAKEYGIVNAGKIADREKRTQIHKDLRRIFSSRLESATDEHGSMMVTAAVSTGSMDSRNDRGGRGQGRGSDRGRGRGGRGGRGGYDGGSRKEQQPRRFNWQELGGDHLHFTIYKENKDTMEVIGYLTRALQKRPHDFQFAGTKDRRAITVQRASVYRVRAEQMVSAGRSLRYSTIGNFQHQKQGLDLGDLLGNEFVITLRDCKFDEMAEKEPKRQLQIAQKIVQDAAGYLSENGFINYFGLQRFGTFATRTDAVGLKMLQGDLRGAVAAILEFEPGALAAAKDPLSSDTTYPKDDKARAWAIDKYLSAGNSRQALDELPRKFSAEASIIRHMGNPNHRNDFKGALQFIPRNLRLMYVHAYQSLVWNHVASERWARHGKEVVEGDLVLVNDHKEKEDYDNSARPTEELDSDGAVIVLPAAHDSSRSEEDRFERARALTVEEAKSGQYAIFDIVLATPGFDVLYPANEIGKFYTAFMKSDAGGGLDPNDMRRAWKEVSLSGSYRKLIARPLKPIGVEVKSYVEEDEQFVETDMDILQKKKQSNQARPKDNAAVESLAVSSKNGGDDDKTNGVVVENSDAVDSSSTKPLHGLDQVPQLGSEQDEPGSGVEKGASTQTMETPVTFMEGIVDGTSATKAPSDKFITEPGEGPDTYKLAVILKLQLGSSQYATMALRELMKEGGVRTWKPDFSMVK